MLRNVFGEQVGFNKSGVEDFNYESVNLSDVIGPKESKEAHFYTKGIQDFSNYYNQYGSDLKGDIYLTYIKLNNNDEYYTWRRTIPSNERENVIINLIEGEKNMIEKIKKYF